MVAISQNSAFKVLGGRVGGHFDYSVSPGPSFDFLTMNVEYWPPLAYEPWQDLWPVPWPRP